MMSQQQHILDDFFVETALNMKIRDNTPTEIVNQIIAIIDRVCERYDTRSCADNGHSR